MKYDLDFPSVGEERLNILHGAEYPVDWAKLTQAEKIIYVQGMNGGYYQGRRDQARESIDRFTQMVVGFKP